MPLDYGGLKMTQKHGWDKENWDMKMIYITDARLQQFQVGTNHENDEGLESCRDYKKRVEFKGRE